MANVKKIIVSDPEVGTVDYGLTLEGREQVESSAALLAEHVSEALILASDFLRTRETAEIVRVALGCDSVLLDIRLRERFFGEWEGLSHEHYSKTWAKDAFDPTLEYKGGESSSAVRLRMWSVIEGLEEQFQGRDVIIVSHGDPLMLLQTAFVELGPERHRSLPYFETAGWRLLNLCV